MSQRLIVLDEAEEELIDAEKWYEKQRAGLGQEFRIAIDEGMERLLKNPRAASPIVNIIENGEDLWVVAFTHHRRKPGYLRERLER